MLLSVLKVVFLGPIVLFSPGFLVLVMLGNRSRSAPRFQLMEIFILSVATSLAIIIPITVLLGLIGIFNIVWLSILVVILDAVIYTAGGGRGLTTEHIREETTSSDLVFFIILILISIFFFAKPFGFDFLHFREAGDSLNMGFSLAEEATFFPTDNLFRDLPYEYRGYFFDSFYGQNEHTYDLFPSYRFQLDQNGKLIFEYFYAFPALVAIFAKIFGAEGALYISSLIMFLSVFLLYILTRMLMNKMAARLAALLFSLSFLAIYFSWFHEAESLFLLFVLLLLISLISLLQSEGRNLAFTIVFVFAFQASYLVRTEFFFILAGLLLFFVALPRKLRRKIKLAFIFALISMIPVTIFYAILLPRYLFGILFEGGGSSFINSISPLKYLLLPLLVALIIIYKKRHFFRMMLWKWMNAAILVVFVAFILFSLYRAGVDYPFQRFHNLSTLADYSSPLFIIMALSGLALLLIKEKGASYKAVVCISFPILIYFLNEMHNYPLHPWCMRRYMTLAYPILFVFAAYSIYWIKGFLSVHLRFGKTLSSFIIPVIALLLVSGMITSLSPLILYMEEGTSVDKMTAEFDRISDRFSQDDVLLFHMDNWEYSAAYPLKMIYGMNTILMPIDQTAPEPGARVKLDKFEKILKYPDGLEKYFDAVAFWRSEGRSVYMINPSSNFLAALENFPSVSLVERPLLDILFPFKIYPIFNNVIPSSLSNVTWGYKVYEIISP
jgi:hypothetical protein